MSPAEDPIAQHLQHWLQAYGADLAVPRGEAKGPSQAPTAPPAERQPARSPAPVAQATAAEVTQAEETSTETRPDAAVPAARPPAAATAEEEVPATAAATPAPTDAAAALSALRDEVLPCTRCKLHKGRQNTVFGEGAPNARVMFVGEAPGAREDQTGRPFVGPAGQLLDRILKGAMGLERSEVFIANINKCRPPGNRAPEADEVAACLPFLREQVAIVRPEVIVCLGRTAAQNLLGTTASTRALRGGTHEYADIPVIVTWHPAYLLRDPSHKRETWDDIKRVNKLLGLPETPGQQG